MRGFDVSYPRIVLIGLLVVLNLGIVGAVTTSSAPYGPYNGDWDGTSSLRQMAGDDAPVELARSTRTYEDVDPTSTVAFVVAPQKQYSGTDVARLRQFVSRGGTLVVASDETETNQLLGDLGVQSRIDGRFLRDDQENYRNASLPVANNVSSHPFTDDIDGLTLNYGTTLNVSDFENDSAEGRPTYLINTSEFGYIDRNRNGELDENEQLRSRPISLSEPVGDGQVVVVSDGSVFTNAMLEQSGNQQFVHNLAGTHDRVVIDQSHGHPLPPLVYGLLVVRSTPLVQFGLGLVALAGVVVWARRPEISLPSWRDTDRRHGSEPEHRLDEGELAAFLTAEHPEWDEERVERVTKAIIRSRRQSDDNE